MRVIWRTRVEWRVRSRTRVQIGAQRRTREVATPIVAFRHSECEVRTSLARPNADSASATMRPRVVVIIIGARLFRSAVN